MQEAQWATKTALLGYLIFSNIFKITRYHSTIKDVYAKRNAVLDLQKKYITNWKIITDHWHFFYHWGSPRSKQDVWRTPKSRTPALRWGSRRRPAMRPAAARPPAAFLPPGRWKVGQSPQVHTWRVESFWESSNAYEPSTQPPLHCTFMRGSSARDKLAGPRQSPEKFRPSDHH